MPDSRSEPTPSPERPGKTIIRPRQGAGAYLRSDPVAPSRGPEVAPAISAEGPIPRAVHRNPLLAAAFPLLMLAPQMRVTARIGDMATLRRELANGIEEFERETQAQGVPRDTILAASYVLCSLLDDSAGATPWGGRGVWAGHSLLVQFRQNELLVLGLYPALYVSARCVNG